MTDDAVLSVSAFVTSRFPCRCVILIFSGMNMYRGAAKWISSICFYLLSRLEGERLLIRIDKLNFSRGILSRVI